MADPVATLKAMRLYGMAGCYAEWLEQDSTSQLISYEALIQHLIQAETVDRGLRSIRYQMHSARFPIHRDLASFDFEQSKVRAGPDRLYSGPDFISGFSAGV